MNKAVFAGSFDPFTLGHLDLVQRASGLVSELVVLLGVNQTKKGLLSNEERLEIASLSTQHLSNVRIDSWEGLTVEYMKREGIRYMIRGLRNSRDLEWEQSMSWANQRLSPACESIMLLSAPEHQFLSSSVVREILHFGGDIHGLVVPAAIPLLKAKCSL
jgi:pantetheine-phosphate adenylyltransferase